MGLVAQLNRIAKKIRRRNRVTGTLRAQMNRPGRNRQPMTAVQLWERVFRFKAAPAARAGTKRRIARERKAGIGNHGFWNEWLS